MGPNAEVEARMTTNVKRRPGMFLIIMILLLIVGDLQIPYYLVNFGALHSVYREIPSWYPVYAVLGLASNIAIVIGMWRMKKWAIYLLAAYFVSKVLVDSIYIRPDKSVLVFATTAIGAALWALAIYRNHKSFD